MLVPILLVWTLQRTSSTTTNIWSTSTLRIRRRLCNALVICELCTNNNVAPELFPVVCEAAKQIQALGRAGDWVLATASENVDVTGLDKFERRENGSLSLNTPVAGFVDSVFARYQQGTALKLTSVQFAKNAGSPKVNVLFDLTEPVPLEHASHVVSWIRHAAMKRLPAISGHEDHDRRLVIIPIPTLDFRDNWIPTGHCDCS